MEAKKEEARISFEDALSRYCEGVEDLDFEQLLEPYREGGADEQHMVRRTWGTLVMWLTKKLGFDVEVAGAGILILALELHKGLKFEGDGSWGSRGHQLCQYLRQVCLRIKQKRDCGVDLTAFVSGGAFTKFYGVGEEANVANLFSSYGLLEDAPTLLVGAGGGKLKCSPEPKTGG